MRRPDTLAAAAGARAAVHKPQMGVSVPLLSEANRTFTEASPRPRCSPPRPAANRHRCTFRGLDFSYGSTASVERSRHVGFAPNSGHGAATRLTDAKGHVWTSGNRGRVSSVRLHRGPGILVLGRTKELIMTNYVGLDVSQKTTTLCIVDGEGHRQWRGECVTSPEHIAQAVLRHAGAKASIGIETGPMTPWLVHELRSRGLDVICLDARHARAALRMQLNKTDRNDAEGLAQIMRTGWYRAVHVKSFDAHRARALLGARLQLVGMVTRLSNHIRGVLKTFGMLPGSVRGRSFAERVELLVADRPDVAPIVRPMLAAWSKLREHRHSTKRFEQR